MPTRPSPQPSTPESPGRSVQRPADTPPPGPEAAASQPTGERSLFHVLVRRGWDAVLAYTADLRVRAMASEIAAAGQQSVMAELRRMRESMATKADLANFATKADLANFATKADLANFATKADLVGFATKADLAGVPTRTDPAGFATKADLAGFATKADLAAFPTKADLADREVRLIKWVFGAMLAQAALIVALVVGFMTLLL